MPPWYSYDQYSDELHRPDVDWWKCACFNPVRQPSSSRRYDS